MVIRISAFILLLISILFWPFWVSVILALVGIVYFDKFYEAPLLFMLSDILNGTPEAKFSGMVFVSFFASIIILLIAEALKKNSNFRIHNK
jgi:hypothetical protein